MKKRSIFLLGFVLAACKPDLPPGLDPRQEMRDFVQGISAHAKGIDPDFIIIPQNGADLATLDGTPGGMPAADYLAAIDGQGQEDLFYGYERDNKETDIEIRAGIEPFLLIEENAGVEVLVTDYCSDERKMEDSYARSKARNYLSFAADHRELDHIPAYPSTVNQENDRDILTLSDASNFLYLINPAEFESKQALLDALSASAYDVLLIDAFFNEEILAAADIARLRTKPQGGQRLVISYMSIGEAEDYRYYWNSDWKKNRPDWLDRENPRWKGNYKVRYWEAEWQALIYGNSSAYLDRILTAGFDGVYLDIIDAFEYYE
ncbi:MAG: hypothetical protein EAZ89_01150 [Bacteroidetes bacterium]|nr:MAG: hypothetical protein EAZ89_01150 [Bacteroidota bacterium]